MIKLLIISIGKIFSLAIGLINFKSLSTAYRLLLLQILLALITESFGKYIAAVYHANNSWLFNIYALLEMWLLVLVGRSFIRNIKLKRLLLYIPVIITCVWSVEFYLQGLYSWTTKTILLESVLFIAIYFKALFDQVLFNRTTPHKQPIFWISLSIILFFGCILPFMALFNAFNTHYVELSKVFTKYLINGANILRYPMVGIAFYLYSKEKTAPNKITTRYA